MNCYPPNHAHPPSAVFSADTLTMESEALPSKTP